MLLFNAEKESSLTMLASSGKDGVKDVQRSVCGLLRWLCRLFAQRIFDYANGFLEDAMADCLVLFELGPNLRGGSMFFVRLTCLADAARRRRCLRHIPCGRRTGNRDIAIDHGATRGCNGRLGNSGASIGLVYLPCYCSPITARSLSIATAYRQVTALLGNIRRPGLFLFRDFFIA